MPRSNAERTERQRLLYEYCKDRPGDPLSVQDVADALGRRVNSTFHFDLAAVRHRFLDEGGDLTNAAYDLAYKAHVFYYLPAKQEQDKSYRGLHTSVTQHRTRSRNIERHAGYVAKNAVDPVVRAYGKFQAESQANYLAQGQSVDRYTTAMQTRLEAERAEVRRLRAELAKKEAADKATS